VLHRGICAVPPQPRVAIDTSQRLVPALEHRESVGTGLLARPKRPQVALPAPSTCTSRR
jgi:hypothetical protein